MTMYHMAMPPQYGGAHPPPIFPGPLLPPVNQPVHTFPTQSSGGVNTAEVSSAISNHSPMVSQGSSFYHQPSVYINPYLGTNPQSPIQVNMMSPHGMHNVPHSHTHSIGYPGPAGSNVIMHGNHSSRQIMHNQPHHYSSIRRQPLSVDEELLEEMNTLLLGYLETEDSPHKMEQREKLESVILEYLAITPHRLKFMFRQVLEVLENSIMTRPNFNAHEAACAFDALAQYAANLISQPWRKEYREIKLHNGFWVHQVASQLTGAEYILELMGYISTASKSNSACLDFSSSGKSKNSDHYYLQGVIDPDLIARLALDCMIAFCECQSLNKIKEGVSEFSLSWAQILMFRQHYIGGVDVTVRNLLFTLRQRANMVSLPTPASPEGNLSASPPPPLPVRQNASFAATASAGSYFPHSPKASTPSLQHSPLEARYEGSVSVDDCHSKFSLQHSPDNLKNSRSHSLTGGVTSSATSAGKVGYRSNYCEEKSNGVHTSASTSKGSSSRVPTAKLIDLDSSAFESSTHHKTSHSLLPKVLPHKSSSKSNTNRSCLPNDQTDFPTTSQPPPEAFQAGTLEEHLEATLNLVKNPLKNPGHFNKGTESSSWETWDFVYKGLEKKGYNKDVGDRGDILHDMARQKNYTTDISPSSVKNMNVNMNNQRKDITKNRPLTINQALQQFTLHETKERVDRALPSSTKSSHSISHAYVHENHKRNSLYDNLSAGGFETANQDSEESEDKKSSSSGGGRLMPLKKVSNILRQEAFNKNYDTAGGGSSFHKSSNSSENTSKSNKGTTVPDSVPDRYNINGEKIWPCATCTFENKTTTTICEMCGKSRDPGPDAKPLESGGKQCHLCTLINDKNVDVCSACGIDLKGSSTYI